MNKKQIGYRAGLSVLVLGFVLVSFFKISTAKPTDMVVLNIGSSKIATSSKGIHKSSSKKDDRSSAQTDKKHLSRVAPKQAEIKSRAKVEKRYYLLIDRNDTQYSSQWALSDINTPTAWAVTNNSENVVVADIDTGFALNHEDLINQWQQNTGELGSTTLAQDTWGNPCTQDVDKSINGCDDDGNGYVDDWQGWDFYHVDNSPQAGSINPNGSGVEHGTETAGLIGAETDNNIGMSSVSGGAKLMPLQVMSDEGSGYSSDISAAIYYATDNGANVINMSLGTSGDDSAVRDAVDYAVSRNVVVVAAAGNCGNNYQDVCSGQVSGYVTFPANYDRVIAVGAVDQLNNRASFSSYGQRVDIMAPGSGSLISTTYTAYGDSDAYANDLYGTSFASPIVAGAVALIRSIRPSSSVDDVRALIMASGQKVTGMAGVFYTTNYGHGLLDVGKSIEVASDLNGITETIPTVYQAGNYKANSQYKSTDSLGSGCEVVSGTWCTVWLRNTTESYDRFLPYAQTNLNNEYGWSWSGAVMQRGEWEVRARQGDQVTAQPAILFSK